MTSQYHRFIAENGLPDETYDEKKPALFRVQGKSPNNMQAIQVDVVNLEFEGVLLWQAAYFSIYDILH